MNFGEPVIPAKAGIQCPNSPTTCAVTRYGAGIQKIPARYQLAYSKTLLDSGESRNDGLPSHLNLECVCLGREFRLIANPLRCAIICVCRVLCRPASGQVSLALNLEESRPQ